MYYQTWSKDQLIARIQQIEQVLQQEPISDQTYKVVAVDNMERPHIENKIIQQHMSKGGADRLRDRHNELAGYNDPYVWRVIKQEEQA